MFAPDDEDKPFIARWNMLSRILIVESWVKLVMRAAMDYADFDDGSRCFPSNERLARETGLSDRSIRYAWSIMRGTKMAQRVGNAVAHRGLADEYVLQIPDSWRGLPILGPHGRKFTCQECGKLFNPQGDWVLSGPKEGDKPDTVRFKLHPMTFCPSPSRGPAKHEGGCHERWNEGRRRAKKPQWHALGNDAWTHFRDARSDEW